MSTATSTIPTGLTDTYVRESSSALRFTLWVFFYFFIFMLISSSISRICFNACAQSIIAEPDDMQLRYDGIKIKPKYKVLKEDFTNEDQYNQGSEFKFNYETSSKYQSIALTSIDIKDKTPLNMMIGQANRYFSSQNGKSNIILDMFANLYILGGNIFGEIKKDQEYRAYGYTLDNKKIDLGKLEKEQDGFYKLKIASNDPSILQYNTIQIVYKTLDSEQVLLNGKFDPILQ